MRVTVFSSPGRGSMPWEICTCTSGRAALSMCIQSGYVMTNTRQIKSRQRVTAHGEVFTSEREVKAMCDLVADECARIESRFLEPACGDGNFLAEVLRRKLETCREKYGSPRQLAEYERWSVTAVMSIYGVELLPDNVCLCRERLYCIWNDAYSTTCGLKVNNGCRAVVRRILELNILCGDALSMRQGRKKKEAPPIIFAEWSFVDGNLVRRRDYRLDALIEVNERATSRPGITDAESDNCEANTRKSSPLPVKEYPLFDYRTLCEYA